MKILQIVLAVCVSCTPSYASGQEPANQYTGANLLIWVPVSTYGYEEVSIVLSCSGFWGKDFVHHYGLNRSRHTTESNIPKASEHIDDNINSSESTGSIVISNAQGDLFSKDLGSVDTEYARVRKVLEQRLVPTFYLIYPLTEPVWITIEGNETVDSLFIENTCAEVLETGGRSRTLYNKHLNPKPQGPSTGDGG